MSELIQVSGNRCFGGVQKVFTHRSSALDCEMRLGVYLPPQAEERSDLPVLYFLSGLTCTEQNVITKGGAQRYCAEHGVIFVTPDTSPRGEGVADDEGWDLGKGAGFYLSATQAPWSAHYRMDRYVVDELPALMKAWTSSDRRALTGHSMGGHGALVLALKNRGLYTSASAFSPILQPATVPWGQKAFSAYLGDAQEQWKDWDASELVAKGGDALPMLIDQGDADGFLEQQLHSARFREACEAAGQPMTYRLQPGYDHSYYFVSSFIGEHVGWHAEALNGTLRG